MLEIQNIRKQYDNQLLLDDISFVLNDNETICLLGPSGGGKSTLLRIIAGLEEMENGRVLWDGQDLSTYPAHKRHFGLMFQDYALFPHMSVGENVAFGLRMQQVEPEVIQKRVDEVLELVNMHSFTHRRVTDLSGGEQQRVALARALVPQPRLLMLDEPLGALDRALREQLSQDLRSVLDKMDIPVIYVTHDQEEAFAFADRLLILHEGKIIQSGKPAQVYSQPKILWTAGFFGHSNQLPGKVVNIAPLKVKTAYGLLESGGREEFKIDQMVTLVLPAGAAQIGGSGSNNIPAVVKDVLFQGKGFMIDFELSDRTMLTFFFSQSMQRGERVDLTIQSDSILCFS